MSDDNQRHKQNIMHGKCNNGKNDQDLGTEAKMEQQGIEPWISC
jgi:hypothetical protein